MFPTATPKPAEFGAAFKSWRDSSDNWFDGSVGSVDVRLRRCAKLLGAANAAVGRKAISESGQYLVAIQELSADRQALAGLREDLLTGSSGREVGVSPPGRTATRHGAAVALSGREQRWVELESARFLNANRDAAHVPDELAERARRHGETHTSTLGKRSTAVTAAFVDKVIARGQKVPQTRVAAAPITRTDFPDSALFLT